MSYSTDTTAYEIADIFAGEIKGKNIFITGTAIKGLGWTAADAISKYANKIWISGSREARLVEAKQAILANNPKANIEIVVIDLGSKAAIQKAADTLNADSEPLHVLIANATAALTREKATTKDGFESFWGIDHLGHFLLTNLLYPKLVKAKTASWKPRIVVVSSLGHTFGTVRWEDPNFNEAGSWSRWTPYGQAKLANMLFVKEGVKRYPDLLWYAVHPGSIKTEMFSDASKDEMIAFGMLSPEGEPWDKFKFKTLEAGSSGHVRAAFDPVLVKQNGAYLYDDANVHQELVSADAADPVNATKLWELTEKEIGVTFPL